jgi:hypothetical protein
MVPAASPSTMPICKHETSAPGGGDRPGSRAPSCASDGHSGSHEQTMSQPSPTAFGPKGDISARPHRMKSTTGNDNQRLVWRRSRIASSATAALKP